MKDPINTCHFVTKEQVQDNHFRDVTHGKFECTVRTEKAKKHGARLVIGAIISKMQATWERPLYRDASDESYVEQCNINT